VQQLMGAAVDADDVVGAWVPGHGGEVR